ncbi:hypothetical protein [Kitasatospora sp. NPDC097643]|uniref:hypothetical protein n=1 Tax=Kitasatospora sp. NPDC097643 TaxID=3157230 RepID=UPI00332C915C
MSAAELPPVEERPPGPATHDAGGSEDPDEADAFIEFDEDFLDLSGGPAGAGRPYVIYAPHGNINTGSVHGDQHVENADGRTARDSPRVEAHEGPISALELLDAQAGFAEPEWLPTALAELDSGLLFLVGEPGTGRRTAALNLLYRHSGHSMNLRALDGDEDLSRWRPTHTGARGYLVHGLLPTRPLGPAVIANLRRLLSEAGARMVIVLPYDPEHLRRLSRDLHVSPVRCQPPAPRAVFEARLTAAVPEANRRARLLERLDAGLLDELLTPELVPAQVAELVTTVSRADEDGPDLSDLRERLSFLAEGEVPDLLSRLRDDPDGLAFLLATSVFEGLDHRVVREEADRLRGLADGRLDSALPESGDDGGPGRREGPRPNPRFVFRRSLDDLLHTIRAECAPPVVLANTVYSYTVEAVRFTRHRQAEAVLRHVWRQYGELSALLTEWMDTVPGTERELAEPVGRVMGMAASWGGGRRALWHIRQLATSERAQSRSTAAFALGIAANDPVLAGEIKYLLNDWSGRGSWRTRSTVAEACGTDFGAARPELALALLRRCHRGDDGDERHVAKAVQHSLRALIAAGNQPAVLRQLADWADREGPDADLALQVFPRVLWQDPTWFQEQLLTVGEFTETVVHLVRRTLNDDRSFDATCHVLIGWCRLALADEWRRAAVETLLSALAQEMRHGELRLFVEIDRNEDRDLAGRPIARQALQAWRRGESQPHQPTHAYGEAR